VLKALQESDAATEATFMKDVQMSLYKFPEQAQRELVERFSGLRKEAARLVESMAQEVTRWLDEDRIISQRGGDMASLVSKLKALFQAILSAPFLTTFRHLGAAEKRGKEAFLLKTALCLRRCGEKRLTDAPEIGSPVLQLRRQFFFVDGYGELMEDWLQNRLTQCNDDFLKRAASVIGGRLPAVQARFRRTFRPGHWLPVSDPHLQEDIYSLFLDDSFPRHALSDASVASVLRRVASAGGGDLHVYAGIARLPPPRKNYLGPPPQDEVEAALIELLLRLPPFRALKRIRPGAFQFGRLEVVLSKRNGRLFASARGGSGTSEEMPAEDFFERYGPEEFPEAAAQACRPAGANGPNCTVIEALGDLFGAPPPLPAFAPGPPSMGLLAPPFSMPGLGCGATVPALPMHPAQMVGHGHGMPGFGAPVPGGSAPFEPYPTGFGAMAQGAPLIGAPGGAKFGMDDDEI